MPPAICFSGVASSSNHLCMKLRNHPNQQKLLRLCSRSCDVRDLGDMGFGLSPFTLYCTVLCIHSTNITLQASSRLAGRRKEWPWWLNEPSVQFKSDFFFAHSAASCVISHNQLVFFVQSELCKISKYLSKTPFRCGQNRAWRHFCGPFRTGVGWGWGG